jgi:hypothetical protein
LTFSGIIAWFQFIAWILTFAIDTRQLIWRTV